MRPVVWFKEVTKEDLMLVGGKGANLGELTRAGIPVPPGFVVTCPMYFRLLQKTGLRQEIGHLLEGLDATDSRGLREAGFRIKQVIAEAPMPGEVTEAIAAAYGQMGGYVAVRSSATAEDLAEASFAGQQSSYLNVSGERDVSRAVRDCWASLFEPQAIAYRARRGVAHLEVGIAVVVQRMVQSQRSGVMFTIHPVSSDRTKIVIEAVFGLGEACVSGMVTPDLYVVDKRSLRVEEKSPARQDKQMMLHVDAGDGAARNDWSPVPPERASKQKLADADIVALAELGRRVEEHYGAPQDIEWAEEGGRFFVLQARPVTATAHAVVKDSQGIQGSDEAGST